LYEDINFGGASHKIGETNQFNFPSNWNDKVSSVKITQGCILYLFEHLGKVGLLSSVTEDKTFLGEHNDKVSSVSCTCQGKF
jgi:hypothetical protein